MESMTDTIDNFTGFPQTAADWDAEWDAQFRQLEAELDKWAAEQSATWDTQFADLIEDCDNTDWDALCGDVTAFDAEWVVLPKAP
jgi:hypothetical protein